MFSLERLLLMVKKNTFKADQEILSQGKLADALHVIYAGQANVLVDSKLVSTLGPKSVLGERSVFGRGAQGVSCYRDARLKCGYHIFLAAFIFVGTVHQG